MVAQAGLRMCLPAGEKGPAGDAVAAAGRGEASPGTGTIRSPSVGRARGAGEEECRHSYGRLWARLVAACWAGSRCRRRECAARGDRLWAPFSRRPPDGLVVAGDGQCAAPMAGCGHRSVAALRAGSRCWRWECAARVAGCGHRLVAACWAGSRLPAKGAESYEDSRRRVVHFTCLPAGGTRGVWVRHVRPGGCGPAESQTSRAGPRRRRSRRSG